MPPSVPAASTALLSQTWHSATYGGELQTPAFRITNRWLNKGGDIHRRAEHFIWREILRMAGLTLSAALCGQSVFTVRVCQLRLLAVLLLLGEKDLRAETTQQLAFEALSGGQGEAWLKVSAGSLLLALPGELYHTFRVGQQFHRRYVAPQFPKLKPLR
ncbi:hypothetical protein [Atlantibacter hermannii]|uniref:hypothetical protein n=1 Tax=Atlantibacter hermannii TaxID=565 RepID=UPI00254D5B2E|nr:hypothetical protein [Atlantibacter hermannii]